MPARAKLLGETAGKVRPIPPSPMAAWDFAEGGKDRVGHADVALQGGASLSAEGLVLDGKSAHAITPPLAVELKEKTLEAWVRLEGTDQRGGGVLSVLEESGPFDAIVFGERGAAAAGWPAARTSPGRRAWGGRRGRSRKAVRPRRHPLFRRWHDPALSRRPAVREGVSVRGSGRLPGGAEPAGVRHPASSRRAATGCCAGRSSRARLYDRALADEEVAASAKSGETILDSGDVIAALDAEARATRERLVEEASRLKAGLSADRHKAYAVAPRPAGVTTIQIRGEPRAARRGRRGRRASRALSGPDPRFGLAPDAPEAERRIRLAGWITDATIRCSPG